MQGFIAGIVLSGFIAMAVFSLKERVDVEVGYTPSQIGEMNALVASLNDSKDMTKEQAAAIVYLYGGEK